MGRKMWLLGVCGLSACVESYLSGIRDVPDDDDEIDAPDILVSPATLQFGTRPVECPTDVLTITITNKGTAPLVLDSVVIEGGDRGAYGATKPSYNLASDETTEILVDFVASEKVAYEAARVVITSNDPDEERITVGLEGAGGDEMTVEDVFVQPDNGGVDVLFMLDKSSSMESDIEDLKVHFATFINVFLQLGLDFHLGVMSIDDDCPTLVGPVIDNTTPDPAAEFTRQVESNLCNDNETAFDALTKAFSPPNLTGSNAGFLRTDANLAVVVFSDEPEQSGSWPTQPTPQSLVNFLASLKGGDRSKVTFSGLVGPETVSEAANCLFRANPALPSDRYQKAIRTSGGYHGQICNVKVQPFLTLLSRTASGVVFEWDLTRDPLSTDPADWEVLLGTTVVPEGARNGWTYDAGANRIIVDGTAVPKPGEALTVRYLAEAVCE